jgi:hypothetical protein
MEIPLAFQRHAQVEFRLPVSGGPSASKLPPEKRVGRAWGHGAAVSRVRQCLSHSGAGTMTGWSFDVDSVW